MSVEAIAWVKAQHIPSAPQKLIMMVLADRMNNETGECFPGQGKLADECSMSDRALRDHLPKLEEGRFLERRMRFHKSGERKTDAYTFPGFKEWLLHQADSAKEYGERARKSTSGANLPVVQKWTSGGNLPVAEKRETTGGNPPRNHKKNHKNNTPLTPLKGGDMDSNFSFQEKGKERTGRRTMRPARRRSMSSFIPDEKKLQEALDRAIASRQQENSK